MRLKKKGINLEFIEVQKDKENYGIIDFSDLERKVKDSKNR